MAGTMARTAMAATPAMAKEKRSNVYGGDQRHSRSANNGFEQHNNVQQWKREGVERNADQSQTSFSVFVDGLGNQVTMAKLRAIFGKVGRLIDVFIQ